MCGIVGLQLRDADLRPRLGTLLSDMLGQVCERGPDSAGIGLYGDPTFAPPGHATVSLLGVADLNGAEPDATAARLAAALGIEPSQVVMVGAGATTVVHAPVPNEALVAAARSLAVSLPSQSTAGVTVIGWGDDLAVIKGIGDPMSVAAAANLGSASGWQGLAHTRMATESAITVAGSHPFSVGADLCLVHNGSFANHATIRRELTAAGVTFDSENDSEVAARFVAAKLAEGNDLEKSLRMLCERFDGFYTLLVTTHDSFAVVRDAIACKPALVAETPQWVAMASEYRALATLPGIENARVFEPGPNEVHLWAL